MSSLEEWYRYLDRVSRPASVATPPCDAESTPQQRARAFVAALVARCQAVVAPDERATPPEAAVADAPGGYQEPAEARPRAKPARRRASQRRRETAQPSEAALLRSLPDERFLPPRWELLLRVPANDVAQRSYRQPFRESREELIRRLLDPPLTLEETARLLGVCPTTVRRYTNRGLLRHERTPGNQRRFRLSAILEFLERTQGAEATPSRDRPARRARRRKEAEAPTG